MSFLSSTSFDPYNQWLGIPSDQQPADHYRLLGLAPFEDDSERIEAAADERMSLVRRHQTGPRGMLTQPLLNELAAARNCLTSAEAKRAYDERLRQKMAAAPLAKAVSLASGSILEPPVTPPPLTSQAAPHPRADTVGDPAEQDSQRNSVGSFVHTFLLMAGAVLLIAAATFGIGRLFMQQPDMAHRPIQGPTDKGNFPEMRPVGRPVAEPRSRSKQNGRTAIVVMQEGSRDVNLTPVTAALSGQVRLKPIGGEEVLEQWRQPGDQAAWKFKLLKPGFFQLELTYAALDEAGETKMTAYVNETKLQTFLLTPTGALDKWATRRHTVAVISSGHHVFVLRLDDPVDPGCLVVKRVRLSPAADEAGEESGANLDRN